MVHLNQLVKEPWETICRLIPMAIAIGIWFLVSELTKPSGVILAILVAVYYALLVGIIIIIPYHSDRNHVSEDELQSK